MPILSVAILISQIIEIGLDETPSPGSAHTSSTLPDVTSLEEMDDLFRNEAKTRFVGHELAPLSWAVRGDREQVATMFRVFAEKVVDLEYDSLPWVVSCAEESVHRNRRTSAIFQCIIVSTNAIIFTLIAMVQSEPEPPAKPPWAPRPPWAPPSLEPPTMTPSPPPPSPPPPSPPFQTEPVVPFFCFAYAALVFVLCFLCPFLCKVFSPTYRARWYRCLARALCCKGLGNGPDPADWKRSVIYPSRSSQVPRVLPKLSNSLSSPLPIKRLESKRLLDDDGGGIELNTTGSMVQADECSTGRDELTAI